MMKKNLLRELPSVDELINSALKKHFRYSKALVTDAARAVLEGLRAEIINGKRESLPADLASLVEERAASMTSSSFKRVINASGTILHTNIGRAVLSNEAIEAALFAAKGNINLEFDIEKGERGERDSHVEGLLKKFTLAESVCVVNNNAAAVLIALNTLAEGREVIISRGELIEIGGSFRLPEIIKKSGCVLREVGTTNRTHPKDYIEAINENTAIIFKAHTSNYRVVGFTADVDLKELSEIGKKHNIPVVEDLGSGALIDLSPYGLPKEPIVRERIALGADIVTFSGDKLLGGPQAGLVAGRSELIEKIRKNPLKRALRADKLTLSALEATLRLYLDEERLREKLPTLRFLSRPLKEIEETAERAAGLLRKRLGGAYKIDVEDSESVVGGGSLPGYNIPTKAIAVTNPAETPEKIYRLFLENNPSILGRIKKDRFMLDMRAIEEASEVVPG